MYKGHTSDLKLKNGDGNHASLVCGYYSSDEVELMDPSEEDLVVVGLSDLLNAMHPDIHHRNGFYVVS